MKKESIISKVISFKEFFFFLIRYPLSGKRLVECILEGKKWPKSLVKIEDKATAIQVANLLINSGFFHRSEKVDGKKGVLRVRFKQEIHHGIILISYLFVDISKKCL